MAFLALTPVLLGATAASGLLAARGQFVAGKQEEIQAKLAALKAADAARQDEIGRRQNLLRSLASQNALAGAQGVTVDAAAVRTDIRDAQNDLLVVRSNAEAEQRALRLRGESAKRAGSLGAAVSLLDTVRRIGDLDN